MKFGIYAEMQNPPQFRKPHTQVYREILEQVEHADKMGFSTFSTLEHHWFEEFSISTNPLALFSAAAQRTQQIRFRTTSHVLPLHNPMVFLGEVAAADILTGGRIELSFGRGHAWVYPKASIPLEESRERFMESLEILEKAWANDTFSYHGKYYSVDNVRIVPELIQKPHPKIYTGGSSNHNYQLAGEKGWGVLVTPMLPYKAVAEPLGIYRKACREHGHEPAIVYIQGVYLADDEESAIKEAEPYILQFLKGNASPLSDLPPKEELIGKDFEFYASGALESLTKIPYEKLLEEEFVWVGTPEKVRKKIAELIEDCEGLTEVGLLCTYAGMEHWKTIRTQQLVGEQIIPYFKDAVSGQKVKASV